MIRRLFARTSETPLPLGEPQAGAIPYVIRDGVAVFLVVTSRGSGRWVFPKGGLMSGLTAAQSAACEAMEEAGVEGVIAEIPVGAYPDTKPTPAGMTSVSVAMYPLRVERQLEDWPEKRKRRRHWATLPELRRLLTTPGLLRLAELTQAQALASAANDQVQPQVKQAGQQG
ncbi:NUDIX hydrolase [Phenylobacterium sp.]|uniref:NUDIX hydrolase n=1 Tax=Phenylobacterium sp. TaxID=1871053 RepID=UPI0035AF3B54